MLVPPRQDGPLQQGDIISDVPFLVMQEEFNVKAHEIQGQKRLNAADVASFDRLKEFAQGKQLTAASVPLVLQPGIVITQGCDLDHKDSITLARVYPIEQLVVGAREALELGENLALHDMVRGLTEGCDYPNLVYLGPLGEIGRCVADLMRVYSFSEGWKRCFLQKRWKSLSDEGIKYLQGRLSLFTGRFALAGGFWHVGDDAKTAKLGEDQGAVEASLRRVEEKQMEAKRKRSS
jgi:hypothetical protein